LVALEGGSNRRLERAFRNWVEEVPMPKNLKPSEKEPYSPQEVAKIIAACDFIGRQPYERLRARAVVLLLRYTALRISDVATLERDRVRNGEIFVRTTKEGPECPYFFWSGNGTRLAVIRDVTRTLAAAFKASGVVAACSHRFRHTLATEVLEIGGTFEEAADILGDSETIVRKHYAKWSAGRQARISGLLAREKAAAGSA
jgi:integrase